LIASVGAVSEPPRQSAEYPSPTDGVDGPNGISVP
jgi:hypothetical protein